MVDDRPPLVNEHGNPRILPRRQQRESFLQFLSRRLLPSFLRTWQGVLALLLTIGGVLPMFFLQDAIGTTAAQVILGVATGFAVLLRFHHDFQRARNRVSEQEERIRVAEGRIEREAEFPEFLQDQLRVVAERARLVMVKAESRANMLYGVGTLLTVLSVVAPFVSVAVYITSSPLSSDTLTALESLRNDSGDYPSGITLSVQKDWRVLFSGVSIGFLFIAAAGAIFAQHRRQTQTFLGLAKDVDYFDGVVGAVQIRGRADNAELTPTMTELVDNVIAQLLKRDSSGHSSEETKPAESVEQILRTLGELLKQSK